MIYYMLTMKTLDSLGIFTDGTLNPTNEAQQPVPPIYPLFQHFAKNDVVAPEENDKLQEVLAQYDPSAHSYSAFMANTLTVAADILRTRNADEVEEKAKAFFDQGFPKCTYVESVRAKLHGAEAGKKTVVEELIIANEWEFTVAGLCSVYGFNPKRSAGSHFMKDGAVFTGGVYPLNPVTKAEMTKILLNGPQKDRSRREPFVPPRLVIACVRSVADIPMIEVIMDSRTDHNVRKVLCLRPSRGLYEYASENRLQIVNDPDQLIDISLDSQ